MDLWLLWSNGTRLPPENSALTDTRRIPFGDYYEFWGRAIAVTRVGSGVGRTCALRLGNVSRSGAGPDRVVGVMTQ